MRVYKWFLLIIFSNSAVIASPKPMSEEEMGRNTASYYGGTFEEIEANIHKSEGGTRSLSPPKLNFVPDTSSVALQHLSESYIRPKSVAAEPLPYDFLPTYDRYEPQEPKVPVIPIPTGLVD